MLRGVRAERYVGLAPVHGNTRSGNKCVLTVPSLWDATASVCSSVSECRYNGVSLSVLTLLTSITKVLGGEESSSEQSALCLGQTPYLSSMAKVPYPPHCPSGMPSWPICHAVFLLPPHSPQSAEDC